MTKQPVLPGSVRRLLDHPVFQDEAAARKALEQLRWPEGYRCIQCSSPNVEKVGGEKRSHREGLLRCKTCRRQFTVTVATVFHRSKVPLTKWMQVIFLEDTPGAAQNSWQMAQATGLAHKTIEKMRARIYAAVGKYEGPNNIFGRRVGGYIRRQRPESYQNAPKPLLRESSDPDVHHQVRDFSRWYGWRKRNPLGKPIMARGVLKAPGETSSENALVRTERLLLQLLANSPVKLLEKRRQKMAAPSHGRWLSKQPKTKPRNPADQTKDSKRGKN